MLNDTISFAARGPTTAGFATLLFVGSDPSQVYQSCAPTVMSSIVKDAALSPTTIGLPTLNWKRDCTTWLDRLPSNVPIALTVISGCGGTIEAGISLAG